MILYRVDNYNSSSNNSKDDSSYSSNCGNGSRGINDKICEKG